MEVTAWSSRNRDTPLSHFRDTCLILGNPGDSDRLDPLKLERDGIPKAVCQRRKTLLSLQCELAEGREENRIIGRTGVGVLYQIC